MGCSTKATFCRREAFKEVDRWQKVAFVLHPIHTGFQLSLKDVLVHGIALANNKARSIEELLTLLSLCEDSLHAEVLYQVVVARETLHGGPLRIGLQLPLEIVLHQLTQRLVHRLLAPTSRGIGGLSQRRSWRWRRCCCQGGENQDETCTVSRHHCSCDLPLLASTS